MISLALVEGGWILQKETESTMEDESQDADKEDE